MFKKQIKCHLKSNIQNMNTMNLKKTKFCLGDISFKSETKIMSFMCVFFKKKYNQANSSVVNNMQYNLLTIFPLSGPFAELGFVFIDFITYFRF